MRATWAVLLLFLVAASGCKREQSFDEAMHVLCELPKTLDAGDGSEMAVAIAREAEKRVTNEEVRAWMTSVSSTTMEQRDAQVKQMLARAHITDCWMLPPAK